MFGINGGELVVLAILAFLLIGPERLPELAQQLARVTREVKRIAMGAREKVREELGPEFDDLAALDPRQYDPRRIVREALAEDDPPPRPSRPRAARRPSERPAARRTGSGGSTGAAAATAAGAAAVAAGANRSSAQGEHSGDSGDGAGETAQTSAASGDGTAAGSAEAASGNGTATGDRSGNGRATPPSQDEAEPYLVPFDDEAT